MTLRSRAVPLLFFCAAGCNAIAGIDAHGLAPASPAGDDAGSVMPSLEAGSSPGDDGGEAMAGDASPDGSPGMVVSALQCAGGASICVSGGIVSVGRVPAPDAGVAVTDDGFEFGGATCDTTGMLCVTGSLVP